MSELAYQVLGYTGSALVLGAYIAVSHWHHLARSRGYQVANVVGAAMLIVYLWHMQAMPNVILNIVWLFVGLSSLIRFRTAKKSRKALARK